MGETRRGKGGRTVEREVGGGGGGDAIQRLSRVPVGVGSKQKWQEEGEGLSGQVTETPRVCVSVQFVTG